MRFGDVFTTECVPANCYQECLFTQNKVKGREGGGEEATTGMFSNLSNEGRTKVGEEGVMGSIQNI